MKTTLILTIISLLAVAASGQTLKTGLPSGIKVSPAEQELRAFYDAYADDLLHNRGEAIANRYDTRGYY